MHNSKAICKTSFTIFDLLSEDVIIYMLSTYFSAKDLAILALVSKQWNYFSNSDEIWKKMSVEIISAKFVKSYTNLENEPWKRVFKNNRLFHWSQCSTVIVLSHDNLTARRPVARTTDPGVLASKPLTFYRNSFQVRVDKIESWIVIGFGPAEISLDRNSIENQRTPFNGGLYYSTSMSKIQIKCSFEKTFIPEIELKETLHNGDLIKLMVEFETSSMCFFKNGKMVARIKSPIIGSTSGRIFPAASLGFRSKITFVPNYIQKQK